MITQSDYIFIIHPSEPTCNYLHNEGERTRCGTQVSDFIPVEIQHLEPREIRRHILS